MLHTQQRAAAPQRRFMPLAEHNTWYTKTKKLQLLPTHHGCCMMPWMVMRSAGLGCSIREIRSAAACDTCAVTAALSCARPEYPH